MSMLVLALYGEGATDERFLAVIVQRTAQELLLHEGHSIVDVLPPYVVQPDQRVIPFTIVDCRTWRSNGL
ncbi:hypothetical protein [Candidatus Viridilinea mediisalina]|uniref:Uncharacterized protein n=1 Tax=Candidatus Viridilinea mediisalina TaxID=2024553 RepID=A0A2A6RF07_9CHLR|nr:hypothetical protein [Candidatus Viridilinea mediisalina]PDW01714.1 hypothetical protein CJ255_17660 [Candidatus Viridilinea mediisalina]